MVVCRGCFLVRVWVRCVLRLGGCVSVLGVILGLGVLDVGFSLAGRSVFEHRAVVLGGGRGELLGVLRGLWGGSRWVGWCGGVASAGVGDGGVVFLFAGSGFAVGGYGAWVVGCSPVFAEVYAGVW